MSADWLEKTLVGMKLRFDDGTEHYREDGSYRYTASTGETYDAPHYQFYDSGFRCIDYPNNPRFDFYVVHDGKLVLINYQGGRFPGELMR